MKLTIEVSYYPLESDFKTIIKSFISKVRSYDNINVVTNNVSTQISGDYSKIMEILNNEIGPALTEFPSVFVVKFLAGDKLED
jgi:uncharacterized protein YqgV (UPF0045/DUF77 family)